MFAHPVDILFPDPPEGLDPVLLDEARVPAHVGVIMDGNGRWAKQRGWRRLRGHKAGIAAVRETIRAANDCGVRCLTLYSFSTENWKRPDDEVAGLMDLFARTMLAEVDGLHEEGVRVRTVGDCSILPRDTREAFAEAAAKTAANPGMTLALAVNYGGRDEILRAVRAVAQEALERGAVPELDEAAFGRRLDTAGMPDVDLVIRTSGEMRTSNFLPWQAAYAEFWCTPVLWPDFDRYEFLRALLDYQGRTRRYGGV